MFVLLAGCHDFDALRGTGLDAGHDGAVDRDAEVDGGCGTAGSPDCIIRPSFINAYELATAGGPDILISVGETATWNTDTGEIDHGTGTEQLNPTVENQDADAPPRSVFTVDSLTVERGATLTFEGTNAVAILAVGEIGIAGRVVASAQALVGGPGGASSAEDASTSGLWVSSGRPGEFEEARSSLTFVVINEAWSGGGGASNASIGGEGGDASGNQLNTAPADAAGGDSGGSSPWPHSLVGGGAGGWGICGSGNGSPVPGGAGGGALLLASQTAIEIDSEGVIVAAGAGGRAPIDVAACPGPRGGSGGGGGAGGGSSAGPVVSTPPVVPAQPPVVPPPVPGTNAAETAANYGIAQIGADSAYSAGARGNGVKVAVIDSGISLGHSEFAGRIDTANSIDIVTGNSSTLEDRSGHGSHVAGIIAANADGKGMRGVAPSASLMAIRADLRDSDVCSTPGCGYFDDDVAAALNHARNRGADIVNLSIGKDTPVNGAYRAALEAAVRSGVLVVVAAGNLRQDEPLHPGALADEAGLRGGMLVVGAVDKDGAIFTQTNRAGDVESRYLVAPGVNIYSTYSDGGYRRLTGTSMAAPHVAGAAAALKSAFPSLSMREVAEILLSTADDLGARGRDQVYGNGLVNLDRALAPVGRQQVAGGDTVSGQMFNVATSSLQLGAAFGDALSGNSALANGMVLDAYDRPYRADFRQSIQGRDGTVDFAGRMQRVSLTHDLPLDALAPSGVMAGLRLSEQQDRPVPGSMRAALTEPADQQSQELDRLMLQASDLPAGDLRFGVGLSPSSVSSGATTVSASDLFLDAHTLLAPVDGILAKGTGGAWHLTVGDSTELTFGVLDSEALSAPGTETYEHEGRLLSFGADQRLGEQISVRFDYAYVDEATALLGSSASGAFAFDDGVAYGAHLAGFAVGALTGVAAHRLRLWDEDAGELGLRAQQ
ncbi:MAG: S8 family serine peptidase, partial [Myxococcales bacterium]|nr:S8 family serine peptidase [Myxococcales bacterium]